MRSSGTERTGAWSLILLDKECNWSINGAGLFLRDLIFKKNWILALLMDFNKMFGETLETVA
jgi:hypothetical protein